MDMQIVRQILTRIDAGNYSFQVIPADTAVALGVESEENLTRQQAQNLEDHLDALESRGFIKILLRSGGGYITVDRLTLQGRKLLHELRR